MRFKGALIFAFTIILLVCIANVNAYWTPPSDINLRDTYDITNGKNITADFFFGNFIGNFSGTVSTANFSSFSNSSIFWASVSSFVDRWFYDDSDVLSFNETLLNQTISNLDTRWNINGSNYLINNSGVLDWNESKGNNTYYTQSNANNTFIFQSEESNLNVNSSVYWDDETSQSNLNVNSSNYWDDVDTFNVTQMNNSDGTLSIIVSWLKSLFYEKDEVYNKSETYNKSEVYNKSENYNKTEIDNQQSIQNNTINSINTSTNNRIDELNSTTITDNASTNNRIDILNVTTIADNLSTNNRINDLNATTIADNASTNLRIDNLNTTIISNNISNNNRIDDLNTTKLNIADAETTYLRLDTSNDPLQSNLSLGNNSLKEAEQIIFNVLGSCSETEGAICWNTEENTIDIKTGLRNVTFQINEEIANQGINIDSVNLSDGTVVTLVGTKLDEDNVTRPTFIRADGSSKELSALVGILTSDCDINESCFVTTYGQVRGLDTTIWGSGKLYNDCDNPGEMTNVIPTLPCNPEWLATKIINNTENGSIFVFPKVDASGGFLINDVWVENDLFVNGTIKFGDQNHFIQKGSSKWNSDLSSDAIWIGHEDEHENGSLVFIVTAENSTQMWLQAGAPFSTGTWGNTLGIIPNSWAAELFNFNMTKSSDCREIYDIANKTLVIDCTSADDQNGGLGGAEFFVTGDAHIWNRLIVGDHGDPSDIDLHGDLNVDLHGETADFFNGTILLQEPIVCELGVIQGQSIINSQATFDVVLNPFSNQQSDASDWFVTSDVLCNNANCARSNGISTNGNIIIQTSFDTFNTENLQVNFYYSINGLLAGDSFTVESNNGTGSGWETVFTDTGTDTDSLNFSLGSGYENTSNISIRFICDATTSARNCYVDDYNVNGTAIATTLTNVSTFRTQYCGLDATKNEDGECNKALIYDPCEGFWKFNGAVNVTGGGGGSGTVTGVIAGNGMDFTTITTSGSVTLGTPGTINDSTSNGVTSTSHTHNISDVYVLNSGDIINGNITMNESSILIDDNNKLCMNTNCSMWICSNSTHMILNNGAAGVTC